MRNETAIKSYRWFISPPNQLDSAEIILSEKSSWPRAHPAAVAAIPQCELSAYNASSRDNVGTKAKLPISKGQYQRGVALSASQLHRGACRRRTALSNKRNLSQGRRRVSAKAELVRLPHITAFQASHSKRRASRSRPSASSRSCLALRSFSFASAWACRIPFACALRALPDSSGWLSFSSARTTRSVSSICRPRPAFPKRFSCHRAALLSSIESRIK